jgi:hypothetical protein
LIDLNGDSDFEDVGELVVEQSPSTTPSGSFTVPNSATTGPKNESFKAGGAAR